MPSSACRGDDGPLIVLFGSTHTSSTKKNVAKVGPPLTKISGSAHDWYRYNIKKKNKANKKNSAIAYTQTKLMVPRHSDKRTQSSPNDT